MKTRVPARAALVTALALAMGAPAFGGDDTPQLLAQATFGGGGPSSSSGSSGTSSSQTSGSATTQSPSATGTSHSTDATLGDTRSTEHGTAAPASTDATRASRSTADTSPMTRMQNWWNEHWPRWNEPARGSSPAVTGYDTRTQGWGPGVQPGASETALTPRLPESDNAQAQ